MQIILLIDKIEQMNRIIIQGRYRDYIMLRIRQVITEAELGHNISPKIQDACEVVLFLISKVKLIHPEFDLSDQMIINETEFEMQKVEQNPELQSDIEVDTFAIKDQIEYYENQRHEWKVQQKKRDELKN